MNRILKNTLIRHILNPHLPPLLRLLLLETAGEIDEAVGILSSLSDSFIGPFGKEVPTGKF